jgi:hypothetical protein
MIDLVVDQKAILVVVGFAVYKDIFGVQHGSEWCGSWSVGLSTSSIRFCQAGLLDDPRFY